MAKMSILLNNLILIIFLNNQSDLVSPVQIQPVLLYQSEGNGKLLLHNVQ